MYTTKKFEIEYNNKVYMDGCGKYQAVATHPPNIFVENCSNGEMVNVIDELNKLEEIIKIQNKQKEVDNEFFNKVISNKNKCIEENEQLKKEMKDLQSKNDRKNKKICSLKDKINELIMTNDIWRKKYLKLRDEMNDEVICNSEFDKYLKKIINLYLE